MDQVNHLLTDDDVKMFVRTEVDRLRPIRTIDDYVIVWDQERVDNQYKAFVDEANTLRTHE